MRTHAGTATFDAEPLPRRYAGDDGWIPARVGPALLMAPLSAHDPAKQNRAQHVMTRHTCAT